jgi:N-ethylmaleimide reductase
MPGLNIEFPIPKEMTSEDIKKAKNEFKQSMKMAKEAGFDGIEINGAFGYLLDSFMKTSCNQRTDHYGGSI